MPFNSLVVLATLERFSVAVAFRGADAGALPPVAETACRLGAPPNDVKVPLPEFDEAAGRASVSSGLLRAMFSAEAGCAGDGCDAVSNMRLGAARFTGAGATAVCEVERCITGAWAAVAAAVMAMGFLRSVSICRCVE